MTDQDDTTQQTFQFWVRDDGGTANGGEDTSDPATVTIDVTPVNDKPIADDATVGAIEDIQTAITLTGDDGDPDVVQTLTFVLTSLPASGTLSETSGGTAITQADLAHTGLVLAGSQLFFVTDQNDTTQQTFQFLVRTTAARPTAARTPATRQLLRST